MFHDPCKKNRPGFTLVELLVVIAIIGILASLAAWGVFAVIGGRQRHNTEETIKVAFKLKQTFAKAVSDAARKETPSQWAKNLANGDADRAQVIWVKVRLLEAFPTTYNEVKTPTALNTMILPDQKFKSHFTKYQSTIGATAGGGAGESSACLLMALKTLGSNSGVSVQDQLNFAIADTDGDGLPEITDAWGKPLSFVRFSTAVPAPAGAVGNAAKHADPIDPTGRLLNINWYNTPAPGPTTLGKIFDASFHPIGPGSPPPNAFFINPLITSLGKDGLPGTGDDIISHKLKLD